MSVVIVYIVLLDRIKSDAKDAFGLKIEITFIAETEVEVRVSWVLCTSRICL